MIKDFVRTTHGKTHSAYGLEVQQVFDIDVGAGALVVLVCSRHLRVRSRRPHRVSVPSVCADAARGRVSALHSRGRGDRQSHPAVARLAPDELRGHPVARCALLCGTVPGVVACADAPLPRVVMCRPAHCTAVGSSDRVRRCPRGWVCAVVRGLRHAGGCVRDCLRSYMFGKGVYFADAVSKSANYCFTTREKNTGVREGAEARRSGCWCVRDGCCCRGACVPTRRPDDPLRGGAGRAA
jgi:hypothetical protein